MNDRQSKIIYPVRKSGRRRTMKITEVEDKENSPTKKALRSNIYTHIDTCSYIYIFIECFNSLRYINDL